MRSAILPPKDCSEAFLANASPKRSTFAKPSRKTVLHDDALSYRRVCALCRSGSELLCVVVACSLSFPVAFALGVLWALGVCLGSLSVVVVVLFVVLFAGMCWLLRVVSARLFMCWSVFFVAVSRARWPRRIPWRGRSRSSVRHGAPRCL